MCAKRSVEEGFEELVKRLNPQFSEPEFAESNLNAIERCLKDEMGMDYLIQYGSIGHGTNVEGFSAIDCFAVMPKAKLTANSNQSVIKVRDVLMERFPEAEIVEGRPAVKIPFGGRDSDKHHVVPAYQIGIKDGHDIYGIPGPSGRWIQSCPGGHSAWINTLNEKLNKKLRHMIRIVKAWNYLNGQPVWSFYLELAVTDFMRTSSSNSFAVDMRNFLSYLCKKELEPFEKSVGTNEAVYATARKDRSHSLEKIEGCKDMAQQAVLNNQKGSVSDAYSNWRKVFNFPFPAF